MLDYGPGPDSGLNDSGMFDQPADLDLPVPARALHPGERLMLAVVWQAYMDLWASKARVRRDAQGFFAAHPERELPSGCEETLPFAAICTHFGWDLDWCRDRVLARTRRGTAYRPDLSAA